MGQFESKRVHNGPGGNLGILLERGCFFHGEQRMFVGDAELLDCLV
jgi:hypothetical protein